MQTYIIKTINKEFYCGKTNNKTKSLNSCYVYLNYYQGIMEVSK